MPWTEIEDPDEQQPEIPPEREIVVQAEIVIEREENEQVEFVTGDWYWVKFRDNDEDEWEEELVCVVGVGSNYVKVKGPFCGATRIHISNFPKRSRPAPEYKEHINRKMIECREEVKALLEEAKEATRRLGVTPQTLLTAEERAAPEERALAVMSDAPDPDEYKKSLVKLKDIDLPAIFEKTKKANERLAAWMSSETIPLNSQIEMYKGAKDQIDGKIFNVSIYAGLQESVHHFAEGETAPFHEKLHVYQRKLFMDEECLLSYKVGGMDISGLPAFNEWLAEPENRDRILPNPRCLVVMQVRRHRKKRDSYGCLRTAMMNVDLAKLDEKRFIYIRNGENLYCIVTDLDFPEKVFPDEDILNLTEPQYVLYESYSDAAVKMVPERTYKEAWKEHVREVEQWRAHEAKRVRWNREKGLKNPSSHWTGRGDSRAPEGSPERLVNPYKYEHQPEFEYRHYHKFDDDNLYFDDIKEYIQRQAEKYNRIALIIQGIFDRSEILHPHPKVCIWKASDFNACIKLVRDHDNVLYDGEEPDIEAYLYENNQKIGKGSLVVGQDDYWQRLEAEKEDRRYRRNGDQGYYSSHLRPYGNPGPGMYVRIKEWKPRARKAVFRWQRESRSWDSYRRDSVPCKLEVPAEKLFNIDAYKPGDFRQFFQDPRTREKYLHWAPVMLLAEEVHAGNFDVELGAMKNLREKGWQSDGVGGMIRITYFKGKKVKETLTLEGGWSKSTESGEYDGPEGNGPDGPPNLVTGEDECEEEVADDEEE